MRWIGGSDPTTRRLIEDILKEEDHADELNDLYQPRGGRGRVTPAPAGTAGGPSPGCG
ncbi:hypothetical protein ACFWMX_21495 [Streptomyces sp. NPDC058378]|uniref:hypothetical protein n=1 Tax=Streptomyces sp. NPDC058378 TaxID=3346469 RepID=UPI00365EF9FF